MINNQRMIEELIKKLEEVPQDIINSAIKEIIEEDKYIEGVVEIIENKNYNIRQNYYNEEEYNIYIHRASTSRGWLKRIFSKNIEVEVA